jgi:uncharacterized protein
MAPLERSDSPFTSAGTRCAAWLYRPEGDGPHPIVVMGHGFSGVREQRLDAYAERFAAAGLAALVFDYRHFGSSDGEPRQLLDIGRQLDDWRAAIAHARALDGIDAGKVALWGSSFSGGHVVQIAAEDPQIAAVVSQAPFTDGIAALRAGTATASLRLTIAGLRDAIGSLVGRPHYIPAAGAPGTTAAMTSDEAVPGYDSITPTDDHTWVNRFSARLMLRLATYRPYSKFKKLRCPVQVTVCDMDVTTPAGPAVTAAQASPNAELIRYPIGHFAIYVDPQFETTIADQTGFLVRNLIGAPVAASAA